jgi:hypothetical protein
VNSCDLLVRAEEKEETGTHTKGEITPDTVYDLCGNFMVNRELHLV